HGGAIEGRVVEKAQRRRIDAARGGRPAGVHQVAQKRPHLLRADHGGGPAAIRREVPRAAQVQPARVLAQAAQPQIGLHPVTQFSHVALLLLDARDWAGKDEARRWDRPLGATGPMRRARRQSAAGLLGPAAAKRLSSTPVRRPTSLRPAGAQLEAGVGQYWWLNPDQIAQALSRNTIDFTTAEAPVANQNFNSVLTNSNLLVTKPIQPPTPPGGKQPAAFTAITGYQSGFNQTDADLALSFPNVIGVQPLRLFAEFVYNWDAVNDDAYGYLGGLRLGQTKVRNDWSIYAFYERLEQEAAISAFTYSDYDPGGTSLRTGKSRSAPPTSKDPWSASNTNS